VTRLGRGRRRSSFVNELVEFASIKPDATNKKNTDACPYH